MRWVAWNKIQTAKRWGGLGLGEIRSLNWALLWKWKWRFNTYPDQLWALVIKAIHDNHRGAQDIPVNNNLAGIWKDILAVDKDLRKTGVTTTEDMGMEGGEDDQKTFSTAKFRSQVEEQIGEKINVGRFKWNNWIPKKITYFAWRLLLGCIPSKGAMVHRGINIGDTTCGLCGYGTETTDHLAASCIMVKAIWWHIHVWLKIPFHGSATSGDDILEDLHKHNGSYQWKKVLEVVMFTTWWRIWKARNELIFERVPFSVIKVVEAIKEDAFVWLNHRSPIGNLDWERWCEFNLRDVFV
ncbi:hypothetical protein L1987_58559 [Smallanthus sonchifolius]|uniref:Uncharacterized protein n=1 Tax=Smallanthus sonchifolius TaxID=185202 RepID=A0ACB9DFV9_9ASTR|nr:hypothetical protein L1987_58559 [Smallanthus sonchifolius]